MNAEKDHSASRFGAFAPRAPAKVASRAEASASQDAVVDPDRLPDDLIEVGYVAQAYGVRGQVKIFPHAGVSDGGSALLAATTWWIASGKPRVTRPVKVLSAREHSGAIAAALKGSEDRNSAEALKGAVVSVRRTDFPKLDNGEYYWVDLIGLDVVNPAGTALGRVSDLIDNGAHSVLRVAYPMLDAAGKSVEGERLIPFVDAYLREVDLIGKRIVVDWDLDY